MRKWLKIKAFCISSFPLSYSLSYGYRHSPSINYSAIFIVRKGREGYGEKEGDPTREAGRSAGAGRICRLWHVHRPMPGLVCRAGLRTNGHRNGGGSSLAAHAEKIEQLRARQTVYFLELKERAELLFVSRPTIPRRQLPLGACGEFWDRAGCQRRPLPCGKGLISMPAMEEKRTRRHRRWKSIHGPCRQQTILPCHCSHR